MYKNKKDCNFSSDRVRIYKIGLLGESNLKLAPVLSDFYSNVSPLEGHYRKYTTAPLGN